MGRSKITTVLFGLDGVIVDTRKIKDDFWNSVATKNGLDIDNFSSTINGMNINAIIDLYFAINTPKEKQQIIDECMALDLSIDYSKLVVPHILDFIQYLKLSGYKLGIVTSSSIRKVDKVLEQLDLVDTFDTVITAESIRKGKPDPMGFVLAQTNLGVQSNECIVFEDTMNGIKAATYAFMRVIAIATSIPNPILASCSYAVIEDFSDLEELKSFLD